MRSRPPPTFAQRLILYGLAIAIPVLVMCGMLVYHYTVEQYRVIEAETLAAAEELATELDTEIQSQQLLLETLGGILGPEMDLARLHRNATQALVPRGSHVIVYDIGGWQILNTAVPLGSTLPMNYDPDRVKAIIERNEPHVSDFKPHLFVSGSAWIVSAPIRRADGVAGLIGIARSPEKLIEVLGNMSRRPIERYWLISDRKDIVVASSNPRLIGQKLEARFASYEGESGVGWGKSLDGTTVVRGHAKSPASGWHVAVAIPTAVVESPLREAWLLFGIGSTLLLTLALALATSVARRLHESVDVLTESAEKLGRGEPPPDRALATREFQHIHDTLVRAGEEHQCNEGRRHLLLRELQHRTNNLLAVVASISRRTMVDGRNMTEAREALLGRLQALANASDTLAAAHWQGADASLVIESEMRAFAGRYTAQGPPVLLSAQAAQNTSLVIHELATNASKYGALSQPDGNVAISWEIEGGGDEPRLVFEWKERGGPPAQPPARQGFGYTLLKTVLSDAESKPEIRYEPDGLYYRATIRLAAVLASNSPVVPQASELKMQASPGPPG